MRKISIIMAFSLVLVFGLAVNALAIPTIDINELTEGVPATVTTTGFTPPPEGNPSVVATLPEFVVVSGLLHDNFVGTTPSSWGVRMLEPVAGEETPAGGVSDFALLTFGAHPPASTTQAFNLLFVSDGFPAFGGLLTALNAGVSAGVISLAKPDFPEDGTLQNLFDFSGLVVNAASDVEVIPIPATLPLVGTGLLGLGLLGWRRKLRS